MVLSHRVFLHRNHIELDKMIRSHVNGQALRNNPNNKPVFVVRTSGGRIRHASSVEILGPSKLVCSGKRPMPAHAKGYDRPVAWIQTNSLVHIFND